MKKPSPLILSLLKDGGSMTGAQSLPPGQQPHNLLRVLVAICCTSSTLREASGLGSTTIRTPGIPSDAARAWAARVNRAGDDAH